MRKAVIELEPNKMVKKMWGSFFDTVEHLEGRELLQLNFEKGVKMVIVDFYLKPGFNIDDVKLPKPAEILNVLRADGQRYTVLLKAKVKGKALGKIMKLFDLDIIYDLPYYADKDKVKLSCIGENESLKKIIKLIGLMGNVKQVSFTKATFNDFNMLNILTEKQKEIMIEANRNGYYNYPRKVNTQELSEKLGISKATTVEHLRKAEVRLIGSLLEGYA